VLTLLGSKDFKDIKKKEVYDESSPGTIISQDPPAGEKVTPESTVITFKVSKGQQKIILKDLTVYNSNAAQDYANSAGLTIDTSQEQYSDTIPKGMVITQSPSSGTEMQKGDKITVVISKGKEEKPPKTVTKDLSIPYEPTVPGAPQTVQIYIGDMNRSISEPIDSAPITVTQTYRRQIELTIEEGKTAEYKVVRDGKVYMDETIDYSSIP
jgi:serine/threonine-protein kinase